MTPFWKNINLGFLDDFTRSNGFVAFDVGSRSVKMVEAAVDRNGWQLLNAGICDLPEGAVQNNMVVESAPVVEVVRQMVQDHSVKAKKVISAVPGRAVIMKKFQLPAQQPEELEANVEFEANKVIPENLENARASRLRHGEQLPRCSASWRFKSRRSYERRARSRIAAAHIP